MITSKHIINIVESKKSWETTTYKSWDSMKQRCCNKNNARYSDYGGRGIKVCDRWMNSYDNFLKDMGNRPEGKTLDRKNGSGNYTPENCVWSDIDKQNSHTRGNRDITYKGKTLTMSQWANKNDIKLTTLASRLDNKWSNKDALRKSGKNEDSMITTQFILALLEGKPILKSIPKEMKTREVLKVFKKMGFVPVRQEGDHMIYKRGSQMVPIIVGKVNTHNGLIINYLHQSGVTKLEFLTALALL